MINKNMKSALYAEILKESSEILEEVERELQKELAANRKEDEKQIRDSYRPTILSYQRIKNNSIIMLMRNGAKFYVECEDWKNSQILNLRINGEKFTIDLQSAKTLLSTETEKILDKAFSAEMYDNQINLDEANLFDFNKYQENSKKTSNIEETTKKKKPDKKNISADAVKKDKETGYKQKKESEPIAKEKSDKEDLSQNSKKFEKIKENQSKGKQNNEAIVPVVEVEPVDIDELFMDDDEYISVIDKNSNVASPVKTNTDEMTCKNEAPKNEAPKNEAPKIEEPKKEESLQMIDEAISIFEVKNPEVKIESEQKNIGIEDIIMDIYTVKFTDKKREDKEKVYTIIVAPASCPDEETDSFAPTFSFAKIEKNVCTCTSPNKTRPSYQIMLDNEIFVVRGRWDADGFSSLLYPQNTSNKLVSVQKKQMKPLLRRNIGHNVLELSNGLKFHILPMSSKNNANGQVGVLVCLEDPIEEFYLSACTKDKNYIDLTYNKEVYRISANWNEKKLISSIQKL